jgi:hypothetical protein
LCSIVYNITSGITNRVEMRFCNAFPINVQIEQISLLVEAQQSGVGDASTGKQFESIELLDLSENSAASFVIPSNTSDYNKELGFVIDRVGQFKIMGEFLNFFLF